MEFESRSSTAIMHNAKEEKKCRADKKDRQIDRQIERDRKREWGSDMIQA